MHEEDSASAAEASSQHRRCSRYHDRPSQAYNPTGGTLYQLGSEPCLKGRGNCAVYPKSAQLPSGRLVASFENPPS